MKNFNKWSKQCFATCLIGGNRKVELGSAIWKNKVSTAIVQTGLAPEASEPPMEAGPSDRAAEIFLQEMIDTGDSRALYDNTYGAR